MIQLQTFKEKSVRLPKEKIYRLFEYIYINEIDSKSKGNVNLIFSDDEKLQELNNQFRKINKATDVLSFNIDEPVEDDSLFGEIYISIDTAKKQANEYKASLSEELLRLCCHGFLHLLGYDHMKPDEEAIMKEKENKYLLKVFN